jgi:short subunit dehydrogenase-like uncharacterized protein
MPNLLLYGATGYTGRLATQHAQQLGLDIVVGGRSETIRPLPSSSTYHTASLNFTGKASVEGAKRGVGWGCEGGVPDSG